GGAIARGGALLGARRARRTRYGQGALVPFRGQERSTARGLLGRGGASAAARAIVPRLSAPARVFRLPAALSLRRNRRIAPGLGEVQGRRGRCARAARPLRYHARECGGRSQFFALLHARDPSLT